MVFFRLRIRFRWRFSVDTVFGGFSLFFGALVGVRVSRRLDQRFAGLFLDGELCKLIGGFYYYRFKCKVVFIRGYFIRSIQFFDVSVRFVLGFQVLYYDLVFGFFVNFRFCVFLFDVFNILGFVRSCVIESCVFCVEFFLLGFWV